MIDYFHEEKNRHSYGQRRVDKSWKDALQPWLQERRVKHAADVGCGGGIYAKALVDMGVSSVTGIDFSEPTIQASTETFGEDAAISMVWGTAEHLPLAKESVDLVLARALIHHLNDVSLFISEANRVLKKDGLLLIQDRTLTDCLLPGSRDHVRGYFFTAFPELVPLERKRRPAGKEVLEKLSESGFGDIEENQLWETRKRYPGKEEWLHELKERTGRSILQHLSDEKLEELLSYLNHCLPAEEPIVEKDRWTIWKAEKKGVR
ncbi:class I SAM-dependent methyltransferase [Salsuginibacillus kocurii]|uniref:class I SAM-dependent methyltransferase n=1 Tax=Salsuginibacillus kocurii TaxID=427078 RepID=UPI00035FDDA4|nr:class I SAM-dependent methyltransferase [Salsuginibacillus kocurii]